MNLGVKYGKTHLSILVYADDIVLISETGVFTKHVKQTPHVVFPVEHVR